MAIVYITDDGDEQVFVTVNNERVGVIDHETYGWAGMEDVIKLVENLCAELDADVVNVQDIV